MAGTGAAKGGITAAVCKVVDGGSVVGRAMTLVQRLQGAGSKVDASHDAWHVLRVLTNARHLVRPYLPLPLRSLVTVSAAGSWWRSTDVTVIPRLCVDHRAQAAEERSRGAEVDQQVVDLAAVLHDVDDWKYRSPEDDGSASHAQVTLPSPWLETAALLLFVHPVETNLMVEKRALDLRRPSV